MPRSKKLQEAGQLLEASAGTPANIRKLQIISAGWGSSGYYSEDVLQEAAESGVIPAGTKMYLNHATQTDRKDIPERRIQDIAAVLTEDASYADGALFSMVEIMGPHAELIESLAPYIGASISGDATDITIGEAEGKRGKIVEGIAHVSSVDFVTNAGRGGMLLESARPSTVNRLAMEHGLDEATVNDKREQLQTLLRDAHGGDKIYVWVRDFDDTTVWFEIEGPDDSGVFAQSYAGDDTLALAGDHIEVRVSTKYVPVSPAGVQESEEDTMPKKEIEESELSRLTEAAGRVTTLEERAIAAEAEAKELREANAKRERSDAATAIIEAQSANKVRFSPLEVRGLLGELPLTEAGGLDKVKFTEQVDAIIKESLEESAKAAQANGVGQVTGFGAPVDQPKVGLTEADYDKQSAGIFGRPALQEA